MTLSDQLALLNASLNALSGCLLIAGLLAIKRKDRLWHARFMGAAFVVSMVFLVSYLARVYISGIHRYPADAPFRNLYYAILITHVSLAALVPFLAIRTLWLALKIKDFVRHRRIARITWPIWMYVSVTGVLVYVMLYRGQAPPSQ